MVPMFTTFFSEKNHKIAKHSTTNKAKISAYLESLDFQIFFNVCSTKFKNNPILLNKTTEFSTDNQAIYRVKEPHCLAYKANEYVKFRNK